MGSKRFSKQKSFHSFKTKGVNNFKIAFDLASYTVYRMSRQDNAPFVEQSLSTEVVSYFYLPSCFDKCPENYSKPLVKRHRFCMHCVPFILFIYAVWRDRRENAVTALFLERPLKGS